MPNTDPEESAIEIAAVSGASRRSTDPHSSAPRTLRSTPCPDDGLSAFLKARSRLFGVAYRMLGSAAEADDIVQDVWIRWQTVEHATVRDPEAFLVTSTIRVAINHAKSAPVRRETYIGTWLPEPVDTSADPALGAERAEALGFAVLLLLEKLTPKERAAYILREAFNYEYEQIARIIRTNEANCRQLTTRARKHIAEERHVAVEPSEQRRLLEAFMVAAQAGDVAALEGLFAADVSYCSDGGGLVRSVRKPIVGRSNLARFMTASRPYWEGLTLQLVETNGQSSVLVLVGDTIVRLITITASSEGIDQVYFFMRPSKLASIAQSYALRTSRELPGRGAAASE